MTHSSRPFDEASSPEDTSEEGNFPTPDQAEVVTLLRDHMSRLYPDLEISDADYDRLAAAVLQFRNANLSVRAMDRVAGHADLIKNSLDRREAAASEFELITGIPMESLFEEEEPPVTFGADERPDEADDEIVEEYLSDYRP
jgi:hypothetical protein